MICLEVLGEPAPKGSMRAMLMRGKPILVPGGTSVNQRKLRAWTSVIRESARAAVGRTELGAIAVDAELEGRPAEAAAIRAEALYHDTPLEVQLLFKLVRPKSHFGAKGVLPSAPAHPLTYPDIDKLARAVLDALTGVLYDDDGRIALLTVEKQWSDPGRQGVVITLRPLVEQGMLDLGGRLG